MNETQCDSKPTAATTAAAASTATRIQNQFAVHHQTPNNKSQNGAQCELAAGRRSSSLGGLASDTPTRNQTRADAKSTRHCFSCGKWLTNGTTAAAAAAGQHPSPGAQQQRARILRHIRCLRQQVSPLRRRLVADASPAQSAPKSSPPSHHLPPPAAGSDLTSSLSSLKYSELEPQQDRKLLIEFGRQRKCQLEFERLLRPSSQQTDVDDDDDDVYDDKSSCSYEFQVSDIKAEADCPSKPDDRFQVNISYLSVRTTRDADSRQPGSESQRSSSGTSTQAAAEARLFLSPLPAPCPQTPKSGDERKQPPPGLEVKLKFRYLAAAAATSPSKRILIENSQAITRDNSDLSKFACDERALAGAVCLCHLVWLERVGERAGPARKKPTTPPSSCPSVSTLCSSVETSSGGSSRSSSSSSSAASASWSLCSNAESCSSRCCDCRAARSCCRCSTRTSHTGSACSLTSSDSSSPTDQATCSSQSRHSSPASSCCVVGRRHRRRRRRRKRLRPASELNEVAGGGAQRDYANNLNVATTSEFRSEAGAGQEGEHPGYSNRNKLKNRPTTPTVETGDHKFVDQPPGGDGDEDRDAHPSKQETDDKVDALGQARALAARSNSIIEIETGRGQLATTAVSQLGNSAAGAAAAVSSAEPIVEQSPSGAVAAAKLSSNVSTRVESASGAQVAPPKPPRSIPQPQFIEPQYLLNPMEFVFVGASGSPAGCSGALESARAHSFTATSMSHESSSLVAQLAAAARSRSLCAENQKTAELQRRLGSAAGQRARLVVREKVENITRRMSRFTRQAIDRLRTGFSASNPNLAPAEPGRNSLGPAENANTPKLRRGRFTSQRVTAKRARPARGANIYLNSGKHELEIVPYWSTGGARDRKTAAHDSQATCSGSALSLKIVNQDEQLLFAPGGVYVGGAGSWLESALADSGSACVDLCAPESAGATSRLPRHSSCASPQVTVPAACRAASGDRDERQSRQQPRSAHAQPPSAVVIQVGGQTQTTGERMTGTVAAPGTGRCLQCDRCTSDTGDASPCAGCMIDGHNQIGGGGGGIEQPKQEVQQPRQRATSVGQCVRAATIECSAPVPAKSARNQYFTFERCTSTRSTGSGQTKKHIERVSSDGSAVLLRKTTSELTQNRSERPSANSTTTKNLRHPSLPIDDRQHHRRPFPKNMSATNSRLVPPALVSGSSSSSSSASASKPHHHQHQNWLLSLTQRVGGGASNNHPRRTSGQEAYLVGDESEMSAQDTKGQVGQLRSSSPPPLSPPPGEAHLAKETRSSSLSGLFYQSKLVDLTKSSVELNFVAESLAEQTSLFLAELNDRFSSSSHELTPPAAAAGAGAASQDQSCNSHSGAWYKRSGSKLNDKSTTTTTSKVAGHTNDCQPIAQQQQVSALGERVVKLTETEVVSYGANLQSTCVHCQLITELSSHPESSYLSQLVISTVRKKQEVAQDITASSIKGPSLVLTTCSNQGTIDDDDADEEEAATAAAASGVGDGPRKKKKSQQLSESSSRRGSGTSTGSNKRAAKSAGESRRRAASMAIVIVDERGERCVHSGVSSPRQPLDHSAYSSTASLLAGNSSESHSGRQRRTRARKRRESSHSTVATTATATTTTNSSTASLVAERERANNSAQPIGYVELVGSSAPPGRSGLSSRSSSCSSSSSSSSSLSSSSSSPSSSAVNSSIGSSLVSGSSGTTSGSETAGGASRDSTEPTTVEVAHEGGQTRRGVAHDPHPNSTASSMKTLEVPAPAGGNKQIRSNSLDAPYLMSASVASGQSDGRRKPRRAAARRRRKRRLGTSAQLLADLDYENDDNDDDDDEDYDDDDQDEDEEEDEESGGESSASDDEPKDPSLLQVAKGGKSNRSRSVDISLPTQPGESYGVREPTLATTMTATTAKGQKSAAVAKADKLAESKMMLEGKTTSGGLKTRWQGGKKLIQEEIRVPYGNGETRALKLFVDWDENCTNGEHLWVYMGSSSEACYVGESECSKQGPRLSCSACKITAHTGCIGILTEKIKFICKHTFKDLTVSNSHHLKELQQQNVIYHHWVHKRAHCGRCKQCTKSIGNTKLPFSSKEIQAITCSWCKVSYHNKENCYTLSTLTEPCTLGAHRESIIPPSWILKLPPQSQANSGDGSCILASGDVNRQAFSNHHSSLSAGPNNHTTTTNSIAQQQQQQPHAPAFDIIRDQQHQPVVGDELINLGSNQTLGNSNNNSHNNFNNNIDSIDDELSNAKENNIRAISILRQQQQHNYHPSNQHHHQDKSSSSTTLTTDTSGYATTTDNSNVHSIGSHHYNNNNNNNNNNDVSLAAGASNNKMNYHQGGERESGECQQNEIIMDPSALHAIDLSLINQTTAHQGQQQHHQFMMDTYRDHTNPQHDRDMLSSSNSLYDATSHNECKPERGDTTIYHNFKIVPQPISGVPNAGSKPVLVFVNPRSGGNQGAKMMQKFNWLLNPRQVFDLIQSNGPRAALELYRDVPNLRILTIGGDGTASWILSHLDDVGIPSRIPVAVLPLGTGNDLARALGWGGGYTDEPIVKILAQVREGEVVQLDRWNLHVERNHEVAAPSSPNEFSSTGSSANIEFSSSPSINSAPSSSYYGNNTTINNNAITSSTVSIVDQSSNNCDMTATGAAANGQLDSETGTDRLPMDVINNYFSFGVDAHIALEFHTAREAHPERFTSRIRNRMFYGQAGGKDLLKRKWKDLSNFVTLYCDGQDMTSRLKELKVHSVLFLNIPSYGGGTRPWPTTATAFAKPRTDDGLIEVIGLTTYQLPLLQAGGHGTCIAQCRSAKIITSRTIPMQVDGEPCKLLPSIININLKNRVCMLAKSKGGHPQKLNP